MNKRIRKKKHLGEFDFKGFEIVCHFHSPLEEERIDRVLDLFCEFADKHNFGCGGGVDAYGMTQFITKEIPCVKQKSWKRYPQYKDAHCTEEDQKLMKEWLESLPDVKLVEIGKLVSAHHSKW